MDAIGYVRSPIADPRNVPFEGQPGEIVISEEWEEALDGIEHFSHVIVLGLLDGDNKVPLKVHPMGKASLPQVGLLATRSPLRPNSISFTVCRVAERTGNIISVDSIDLVDGTPVVDIKPYHPSTDSVFGARTPDRFDLFTHIPEEELLSQLMKEASNFHGDRCAGIAIGVRIVWRAMKEFKSDLRDKDVTILSKAGACMTDAVQALTGANSKRLHRSERLQDKIIFRRGDMGLVFTIVQEPRFREADEVLRVDEERVFRLEREPQKS